MCSHSKGVQIAYFPACYHSLGCPICLSAASSAVLALDLAGPPAAATQARSDDSEPESLPKYCCEKK